MARIRTTKPEFWTSEQVLSCSPLARLMFIGLWNFCDDNGVHTASHVRLKAEVFPGDDISVDKIKRLIAELISNNLLREYSVDGKLYWIVTGWKKHQRIEKPTTKYPLPQSDLRQLHDHSTNTPRKLNDNSANSRRLLDEPSTPDRNGMDGNWNGDNTCGVTVVTPPRVVSENHLIAGNNIHEIFSYWQTTMSHPRAVLDNKRKGRITQALKLGYSTDDLKKAIYGCAQTPFNMGHNDRNQKYDDIELIFRDASHIDRFIESATNPPSELNDQSNNNFMLGAI